MQNYRELMNTYANYHTKKLTLLTHFIGVPLIIIAIQILLSWVHFTLFGYSISLAWIVLIGLTVYYLFWDVKIALLTGICLLILTYIGQLLATPQFNLISFAVFCILFVFGWIAQLLGHYHEGNKPAFLENLYHLLIAPFFLAYELKVLLKK